MPNVTLNPNPVRGEIVGSRQTIECRVDTAPGVITVSINWTGPGGVTIMNNDRINISLPTPNGNVFTSNLQFEYLMQGDEGIYTCNVMILGNNVSESVEIESLSGKMLKSLRIIAGICREVCVKLLNCIYYMFSNHK